MGDVLAEMNKIKACCVVEVIRECSSEWWNINALFHKKY
jgi:hypothetical protein